MPCRPEGVDSKMIIKEYRIPLPMTVEEYRIAQLYMIQVSLERQLDQIKPDQSQPALLGTACGHGLLSVPVRCCTSAVHLASNWTFMGPDYLVTVIF